MHLAKTLLVQLVENGNREISEATKEENDEDEEEEESAAGSTSRTSEVDALVKIFDLRHQILSSQAQFEQTTSTLSKRTEKRLRVAEAELMDLEESRATEARTVSTVVETINKYDQDLQKCKQKIQLNKVILESITHRRNFIRSTNVNNLFVPSYRLTTKQMTASSDQLLYTVLMDKLRGIAKSINEWAKMEVHFDRMTSSLRETLTMIGTKRSRDAAGFSKLPSTPALFTRVKIPPSRRLIERQIANYEVNMDAIRLSRAETRKTLAGVLKIAREEHLSLEIIDLTDLLYKKCRPGKGEEDEDKLEDDDAEAKEEGIDQDIAEDHSEENESEEPDLKKQRVEQRDGDLQTSSERTKIEKEPEVVVTSTIGDPVVEVPAPESLTPENEAKPELESSADEIPLSEASATLADLTPDESVDTVSKSPSRHSILNIETTGQKNEREIQSETPSLLSASSVPEPASAAAESFHQETVPMVPSNVETLSRDTPAQSKFSNFGEERQYSRSAEPQASLGHLLDLHQHEPQPQLPTPQTPADSIFHSDFQHEDTEMSHPSYSVQQMQQEAPKASSFQHQMQQQLEQSQSLPTFTQQPTVAATQRKPANQPKERSTESVAKLGGPSLQLQQQQQQHRAELEKRQQDEEHQNFLNQTLEVLKQQQVPRKNVVQQQPKQLPQQRQPAQPKQPKQSKQPKQKLPPPQQQQQIQAQLQQAQQFQRMPQAQAHPISRGKDLNLHTHSPSQPVQAAPQFTSQLQQQILHPTNASHLQMPTHPHQQLTQQHQTQLHLQTQQQQTLQHAQQQHVTQTQRQIQHPLYGDVQKGISMSALGGAQDLFADHTQQSHMGMELQQQQHQLHQSHLSSAADVMRPHHQHPHDLVSGHGSVGSGLNSHFGASNASTIPSSNTLRSTPFLTADARGTQQRSFYSDDSQQQQHGHQTHQAMHSHDLYSSQLAGHQQQHHLYGSDLHQQHQHQQQQQQQSRSILTDQDYQSHLLNRHYRNQQDMDPSGSDDVNMGPWN